MKIEIELYGASKDFSSENIIKLDLKINGKKCKRIGINDGKKWSEPVKNAHYIGMADCFQYYNPTIKEYISSRIKQ